MTRIILDQPLQDKLANLTDYTELCDRSGKILGYFLPAGHAPGHGFRGSPLSTEELQRRGQEPGGHTLAEIWTRLGKT